MKDCRQDWKADRRMSLRTGKLTGGEMSPKVGQESSWRKEWKFFRQDFGMEDFYLYELGR